jgi:hypothetical protein
VEILNFPLFFALAIKANGRYCQGVKKGSAEGKIKFEYFAFGSRTEQTCHL